MVIIKRSVAPKCRHDRRQWDPWSSTKSMKGRATEREQLIESSELSSGSTNSSSNSGECSHLRSLLSLFFSQQSREKCAFARHRNAMQKNISFHLKAFGRHSTPPVNCDRVWRAWMNGRARASGPRTRTFIHRCLFSSSVAGRVREQSIEWHFYSFVMVFTEFFYWISCSVSLEGVWSHHSTSPLNEDRHWRLKMTSWSLEPRIRRFFHRLIFQVRPVESDDISKSSISYKPRDSLLPIFSTWKHKTLLVSFIYYRLFLHYPTYHYQLSNHHLLLIYLLMFFSITLSECGRPSPTNRAATRSMESTDGATNVMRLLIAVHPALKRIRKRKNSHFLRRILWKKISHPSNLNIKGTVPSFLLAGIWNANQYLKQ